MCFLNRGTEYTLSDNMPTLTDLRNALIEAVEEDTVGIKKAAVLFSGGVDSSLIAKIVSEKIPVKLYCVGLQKSTVLSASEKAAFLLNSPLKKVIPSEEELAKALPKVKRLLKTENFLQLSIALPEFLVLKQIKKDNFKHVFSGQGADELFFGYDEFRRLLEKKKPFSELEKLRERKIKNLFRENLKRDFIIAKNFSLTLHTPYLNKKFKKTALEFSAKENVFSEKDFLRKHVLRELAKEFIPEEIALARKKAIQYDSAIAKQLKRILNN